LLNETYLCAKHSVESLCGFEEWERAVNSFKFFSSYQKPAEDVNSSLALSAEIFRTCRDLSWCCLLFCIDLCLQIINQCFGLCKALLKREQECLLSPKLLFRGVNTAFNKKHLDIE